MAWLMIHRQHAGNHEPFTAEYTLGKLQNDGRVMANKFGFTCKRKMERMKRGAILQYLPAIQKEDWKTSFFWGGGAEGGLANHLKVNIFCCTCTFNYIGHIRAT